MGDWFQLAIYHFWACLQCGDQVKVELPLCLTKYHAMKTFWAFALDGNEWSVARPCHFTPRERALGTHWI